MGQTATLIPAFEGGVRADAVLKDPAAIIAISSGCYDTAPTSGEQSGAAARKCIDDQLRQAGAGAQAIAFADYAPVPAAIAQFRNYRNASTIFAVMRWADGDSGWCLIGRSGEAVAMWDQNELSQDAKFKAFAREHPDTMLWMPTGAVNAPKIIEAGKGVQRFMPVRQ
jgi:hypothetical protein